MTTLPPRRTPYFVAGGTLGPHIPSYVTRPTDDELFERVLAGELCYVLTPRQMGKSSLVARTMVRLREAQIGAVAVDLQDSGGLDEETFYLNILDELRRAFQLDLAVEEWWDANGRLGASLRFRRFFTDHLLPQVNGRVVIFIDEIDTMLTMPFRDNFFAAIRLLFNDRSGDPELERLTFVLLGVASPSELIADSSRTPFNIGKKINLREFEPADAEPLLKGLQKAHPAQAKAILERIFYWTSGHPYLTQQLCLLINQTPDHDWHDAKIDALVRQTFLSDEARNEDNIKLIQSRISGSDNKRRLLNLYKQVYRGQTVKENKASVAQNQLLLSGLVSLADGRLQVRNQIYRNVFDRDWIRRETEINWGVVIGAMGGIIALLAILALLYNSVLLPNQQRNFELNFLQATSPEERAEALAGLASIRPLPLIGDAAPYEKSMRDLFFGIESWEQQKAIYDYDQFKDSPQKYVRMVKLAYILMVDADNSGQTTPMLLHLADNLNQLEFDGASALIQEINQWTSGRVFAENSEYENALEAYNNAIAINPNNQATLFERARIFTELGNASSDQIASADNYRLALADLDRVVSFILLQPEPEAGESLPTSTVTLTPTNTSEPTNTVMPTAVAPLPAAPTLELTTMSTPNATDTTPLDTTIMPIQPPPPTPTPRPLPPQFNTRSQWLNLIREFLQSEPILASVSLDTESSESIYPNLFSSSLIETPLPTAIAVGSGDELTCDDAIGCVEIAPGDAIRVASALVITGPNESLGLDSQYGIEIAIADRGEINGHAIELQAEDDGCSAEGGQTAGQKIASDPSIVGIIGTSCSGAGIPMSQIVCEAGIAMISPSSTAPILTDPETRQPCYFRTVPNDKIQGRAMAEFVFNELGLTKAAVVHDGDSYTEDLASVFRDSFIELGGDVVAFEAEASDATNVEPLLTTVAAAGPEIIYYPVFIPLGSLITKTANEIDGLEGVILAATDGVLSPDFIDASGDAAEGMYVSGSNWDFGNDIYTTFLKTYQTEYGTEPTAPFHAHAFDATNMLLDAIEAVAQVGNDGSMLIGRQALIDQIASTSGMVGITGTLSCDGNGDCADIQIVINIVEDSSFKAIWNYADE
ncbi:High-affnity carbon uptake protein Hat/HatR [hydrothermal vent metagenome]|uniref:High-affnity carbon uptake protein Hat/HatR n=1 Tax=hydrothermal vent metagenome TaxID=652676 RepID=A0A3B0UY70_9ZZZZ